MSRRNRPRKRKKGGPRIPAPAYRSEEVRAHGPDRAGGGMPPSRKPALATLILLIAAGAAAGVISWLVR